MCSYVCTINICNYNEEKSSTLWKTKHDTSAPIQFIVFTIYTIYNFYNLLSDALTIRLFDVAAFFFKKSKF